MYRIISGDIKAKLEELIGITNLPITCNGSSLSFSQIPFNIIDNQYVYKTSNEVIIVELQDDYVSLIHINNNNIMYLYSKTDDSEFKIIRGCENKVSYVDLTSNSIKMILANALIFEGEELLKKYRVKSRIKKPRSLEYTELSFKLPILIEPDSEYTNLTQYIPESKLVVIRGNNGKLFETVELHNRKYSREETFKVSPSLISSSTIPHYKETMRIKERDMAINPYVTSDISASLIPLRAPFAKELYKKMIMDETNEKLYKAYVRSFDDVVYGITYFQNETSKDFYVFEDDMKNLQYK